MVLLKPGYRNSRTNKLAADAEEHTIVLHPVATISGGVTDAETGTPLSNFKFTLGRSQPWFPDDPEPLWDFRGQNGSNGNGYEGQADRFPLHRRRRRHRGPRDNGAQGDAPEQGAGDE